MKSSARASRSSSPRIWRLENSLSHMEKRGHASRLYHPCVCERAFGFVFRITNKLSLLRQPESTEFNQPNTERTHPLLRGLPVGWLEIVDHISHTKQAPPFLREARCAVFLDCIAKETFLFNIQKTPDPDIDYLYVPFGVPYNAVTRTTHSY